MLFILFFLMMLVLLIITYSLSSQGCHQSWKLPALMSSSQEAKQVRILSGNCEKYSKSCVTQDTLHKISPVYTDRAFVGATAAPGYIALGYGTPYGYSTAAPAYGLPKRMVLLPVMKFPTYPVPHYSFFQQMTEANSYSNNICQQRSLFILLSLNTYLIKIICKEHLFLLFDFNKCKFSSLKLENKQKRNQFCETVPHFRKITYTSPSVLGK